MSPVLLESSVVDDKWPCDEVGEDEGVVDEGT